VSKREVSLRDAFHDRVSDRDIVSERDPERLA
jgi:hypothetical protein